MLSQQRRFHKALEIAQSLANGKISHIIGRVFRGQGGPFLVILFGLRAFVVDVQRPVTPQKKLLHHKANFRRASSGKCSTERVPSCRESRASYARSPWSHFTRDSAFGWNLSDALSRKGSRFGRCREPSVSSAMVERYKWMPSSSGIERLV